MLLGFVVVLAGYGLRSRPQLLLSVFLGLVAVNFLATGLSILRNRSVATDLTTHIATISLALDPLYLLLFVTSFPYYRRPRNVAMLLTLVATTTTISAALVILRPATSIVGSSTPLGFPFWEPFFIIGNLTVAYAAAWILSLRAAVEAPTESIATRARWLASAVGLVVVTRLGLIATDLRVSAWLQAVLLGDISGVTFAYLALHVIPIGLLTIGAYLIGAAFARDAQGRVPAQARDTLRFVRKWVVALFIITSLTTVATGGVGSWPYGLRWLVFAALLTYGTLAFEVVGFRNAVHRVFPGMGAYMGGTAMFMAVLTVLTPTADAAGTLLVAVSLAFAVSPPAGLLIAHLLHRVERRHPSHESADRRLELYRAALESAWTTGLPDADTRRQLERDRAKFGLTHAEARALEHVVARSLGPRRARLKVGDEPLPGLRITRHIADGGQGRVFEAHDHATGEDLILKEIRASDEEGQLARRRVLRELRAFEGLDHPRIVRLLGVRTPRAGYLLLYEKIDGQTLEERLRQPEKLTEPEVRRIATGLLEALEAAHQQGVVHRDIKPSNILLDRDGEPYLADFGIATLTTDPRDVKATVTNMDSLGVPVGTLAYMAPEQARGEPATPATDLYALGLVLYECLTGEPAIDLRGQSLYQALDTIANARIQLDVAPPHWTPILSQLLVPEPPERAQRAGDVLQTVTSQPGTPAAPPRPRRAHRREKIVG